MNKSFHKVLFIRIFRTSASHPILKKISSFIQIEIEDTGSGISYKAFSKMFRPFFSTKNDGGGFGLYNSYSIINEHQGLMTVNSHEDNGSNFTILLPEAA